MKIVVDWKGSKSSAFEIEIIALYDSWERDIKRGEYWEQLRKLLERLSDYLRVYYEIDYDEKMLCEIRINEDMIYAVFNEIYFPLFEKSAQRLAEETVGEAEFRGAALMIASEYIADEPDATLESNANALTHYTPYITVSNFEARKEFFLRMLELMELAITNPDKFRELYPPEKTIAMWEKYGSSGD